MSRADCDWPHRHTVDRRLAKELAATLIPECRLTAVDLGNSNNLNIASVNRIRTLDRHQFQREHFMDSLKESFEDVADWCETHLEDKRGPEIGMTFGAMLRAYGRLARFPYRLEGEHRADAQRELNAKAEELLLKLSTRFLVAYGHGQAEDKPVEPNSSRTNMTYDPGRQPIE